ncbi:hypothetical protein Drose_04195 [Dactylosporangium roseum]|uniref:Head-to-tail adaptor n=1 Tax=Dactylosporangium roseum TaxID=47989 RepID=A0ABY5Z608_9ACTN|nr:hypothetical protein [Dactylosporangium roseum]UWZ37490.1 hypothetical protein Drose_04195 [Dactylosporangium roseum]
MADQLATPADLASLLQSDLDLSTATLLVEMATAVVQQAAGGQRIIQVIGDVITLGGYSDSWLDLPQIPVTAVSSVVLDGATLTPGADYRLIGNRLWRRTGWQASLGYPWDWQYAPSWPSARVPPGYPVQEPSTVVVTYTHGHAPGAQELQLARSAVLAIAKVGYANPSGAASEAIDDYSVSYDAMAGRMEAAPHLKAALAKKYGRRGGLVRIG